MFFRAAPTANRYQQAGSSLPVDPWQRRSGTAVLLGVGVVLLGLLGRLVHINTSLGDQLSAIASRQHHGSLIIPARRGMILDTMGRVVAASRQKPDVFVDPSLVEDVDALAAELGVRVNAGAADVAAMVRSRSHTRFVVVAPQVDEVTAASVRAMASPAVGLGDREVRTYPLGASTGQVLGFVGRDGHGLEGIELAYDEHLAGENGRRATIRDVRRRALWRSDGITKPPVDGGHIVLTVDSEIQRIAEEQLDCAIRRFEAESGVAIVMSPATGAILAMACQPGFDPSLAASEPADTRRNRAVTDPTEPGSTFKPFIACGALAGGFVSKGDVIDCQMGAFRFGHRLVRDTTPHGLLDLKGIITKSSNIGMGMVGHRMGNAALHETVLRFGFGSPTGVDYPGESSGVVYPLPRWTSYSMSSVPMGYEVAVTPLQLITAFCAIVNDGVLLEPRLVRELLACDGAVLRSFDSPKIIRRVVSSEVARYVARDLLVSVVEDGTGRRAKTGPYRILGKTGTAKLPYVDRRGYEPGAYQGMFMGAAPVEDPKVAALVMIRRPNPKLGYYGGTVAAPAAGGILSAALAYMEVPAGEMPIYAGL